MSEVTREYLSQFRVLDLQEHCNNLGLTQTGSKDELIENIFQHHQSRILQVRKLLNRHKAASEKAQLTEKGRGPRPSTSTTLPGITPITPRLGVDSEPEDEFILLPGKLSSADPSVDEAEASADEQAAHDGQEVMLLSDHSTNPPDSLPGSEDIPFDSRKYSNKEKRCMKMIQDTTDMITEIMDINIELMCHTEFLEFSYYEEKRCTTYYQAFTNAVRNYDNLDLDDPVCNQIISNMETQALKYFKRLGMVKKKHFMPLKTGDNFFKKVDLSTFSGDITGDTSYESLDVFYQSADTTTTPIRCLNRIVSQNETGIHNPQDHYEDNLGLDISTEEDYGISVLLQDSVADYPKAYEPSTLPQGGAMNSLEDVKGPCVLLQDSVADYPEAYESAILTQGNSIEDVMGPCVLLQDSVADCPDVNEPGTLPQGSFLNCPGEDYASSVLQQGSILNCLKEDCRLSILPQGSAHNCLQEVYASMVLLQDSNLNCLDEDNRHCVQQQGGLENYPKEDYEPCVSPQGSVVDCPDKGYGPFLLPNGIKEADGPCVQQGSGGNFHNVDNGPCALLQSKALNYQREDNGPRVLWQGNTLNCLEDMSCVKPQGSVRNPPREDKGPCVLQQGQENCLKEDCGSFVPTQGSAIDFPKIDYWSSVLLQGAAHRCLQEVYVPSVQLQDKSVIYKLFLFLCNSSKVRGVQEETKDIPSDTSVGCVSHQYIQQEDVALLQWLCKDSVLQDDARNEGGGILLL